MIEILSLDIDGTLKSSTAFIYKGNLHSDMLTFMLSYKMGVVLIRGFDLDRVHYLIMQIIKATIESCQNGDVKYDFAAVIVHQAVASSLEAS